MDVVLYREGLQVKIVSKTTAKFEISGGFLLLEKKSIGIFFSRRNARVCFLV
jgi:hypothetical protein